MTAMRTWGKRGSLWLLAACGLLVACQPVRGPPACAIAGLSGHCPLRNLFEYQATCAADAHSASSHRLERLALPSHPKPPASFSLLMRGTIPTGILRACAIRRRGGCGSPGGSTPTHHYVAPAARGNVSRLRSIWRTCVQNATGERGRPSARRATLRVFTAPRARSRARTPPNS